jgi:ABC-2 type transport system permease protein
MRNSWYIALRELSERIKSRSFLFLAIIGPLAVLSLLYIVFVYGGEGKQKWKVLVVDPARIMANKIMPSEDNSIQYSFENRYVELEEFRDAKEFQEYDALVEINEKIVQNKSAFVFYRDKPSVKMQTRLHYQIERRVDEVMLEEQKIPELSLSEYRKIKQSLNLAFRNIYDPHDTSSDMRAWVGLFYGILIFTFIFLFGMTILRSVSYEKNSRIAEVLLASVHPNQLMLGKIIGIGAAAFIQFLIWAIIIGFGLYFMREWLFPDMFDPSNVMIANANGTEAATATMEYNTFLDLVFERLNFKIMTSIFLLFFVLGYLFYGAFFAAIGATAGSESDGQQFVIPIVGMLCFTIYAGYYAMSNPDATMTAFFHYLPFTSPVVVMVKLAQGYQPGHGYELYLSMLVLLLSSAITLIIAGRLYKNGILQYGHRLRLATLFRWLKK